MYGPALDELVKRIPNAATLMSHLKASHTLVADVGRIASQAGVKKLVLSHLVPIPFTGMSDQVVDRCGASRPGRASSWSLTTLTEIAL